MVACHPVSAKDNLRFHQFGPEVLLGTSSGKYCVRDIMTLKNCRRWTHQNSNAKEALVNAKKWKLHFPSFGLPERSTDNSTGGAHPWRASVFSQARTCDACLWLKSLTAQESCIIIVRRKLVCHLVSHACSINHNTKHNLDSTTFSKTTLYTELFQNLYSRQAALTNHLSEGGDDADALASAAALHAAP